MHNWTVGGHARPWVLLHTFVQGTLTHLPKGQSHHAQKFLHSDTLQFSETPTPVESLHLKLKSPSKLSGTPLELSNSRTPRNPQTQIELKVSQNSVESPTLNFLAPNSEDPSNSREMPGLSGILKFKGIPVLKSPLRPPKFLKTSKLKSPQFNRMLKLGTIPTNSVDPQTLGTQIQ